MDDKNILELHVEQQDTDGTAKRAAEYHKRLIHQASILSEKEYQKFLLERLEKDNGFVVRKATNFDRYYAVDREMLFKFLNDTQSDTMEYLRKIYKDDLEETIVSFINAETTKTRGSLIEVLKHGIELSNQKIELMYTKPATTFNPELTKKYSQNIFSVMEEVWASDKERIDVVIFLNGLAIMAFELKCNAAGQSYQDAIYQFRTDRNPKTRLFRFKAGTLVNFAMDLEEVYMTTKLDGQATFFLPFNMGNGHGVTAGAGNPAFKDKYSVSYMWEDILTKDFLPCGVVIKKEDDKLVIENPGSIRTGKKQMLRGGISDPRNKTLMKMFNMIGIGERAGSGIPDIYQVWENEGWPMPVVEESYNPDRTRLSLEFAKKQTIKTSEEEKEPKRSQKGAEKEPIKGAERKKEILKLIKVNSTITQVEIMKELDLTRKQVQKDMKELQEMHIIAREGTNRRGRWIIVKENK